MSETKRTFTRWEDEQTPLNAANMNKIETHLADIFDLIEDTESIMINAADLQTSLVNHIKTQNIKNASIDAKIATLSRATFDPTKGRLEIVTGSDT